MFPLLGDEKECVDFSEGLIWSNDEPRASLGKIGILLSATAQCHSKSGAQGKLCHSLFRLDCMLPSVEQDTIATVTTASHSFDLLLNYVNAKQNHEHCILFFFLWLFIIPRMAAWIKF